jgi:hypothetical protein
LLSLWDLGRHSARQKRESLAVEARPHPSDGTVVPQPLPVSLSLLNTGIWKSGIKTEYLGAGQKGKSGERGQRAEEVDGARSWHRQGYWQAHTKPKTGRRCRAILR